MYSVICSYPDSAILNSVKEQATWFVILGLFMLIVQYGMTAFLKIAAEAQIRRIRRDYLAAILRQEQGIFYSSSLFVQELIVQAGTTSRVVLVP